MGHVPRPAFNAEFAQPPLEDGTAFAPFLGGSLEDILCDQFERTVGKDNCVRFEDLTLQIPSDRPDTTTSKLKAGFIATRTARWRRFTVPAGWQSTMPKGKKRKTITRLPRNSVSRRMIKRTFLFVANRDWKNAFWKLMTMQWDVGII